MLHAKRCDSKRALVVVPDNKLSLAIGRRGQNVRLAAHLTGYRIDIKSASEFEAMEAAEEVLVTSMKEHQRYFVVRDQDGKLLPNFISVRNGNAERLKNVIKGNEKVLVARLEDGEFFWREDQKLVISDLVEKSNL